MRQFEELPRINVFTAKCRIIDHSQRPRLHYKRFGTGATSFVGAGEKTERGLALNVSARPPTNFSSTRLKYPGGQRDARPATLLIRAWSHAVSTILWIGDRISLLERDCWDRQQRVTVDRTRTKLFHCATQFFLELQLVSWLFMVLPIRAETAAVIRGDWKPETCTFSTMIVLKKWS